MSETKSYAQLQEENERLRRELAQAQSRLPHRPLDPFEVFASTSFQALFETGKTRRWTAIRSVAERKLTQLDAAATLDFLRAPPGNRLEALQGDRTGQHSIRINDQWRLCFRWTDSGPEDVEIVDYH